MRRIRNANDFLREINNSRKKYEEIYIPRIAEIRKKFANNPTRKVPPAVESQLEAHGRQYFVDTVFQALNWQLESFVGKSPSLIPEAPIHSISEGTTRFLDYLGMDDTTGRVLLIIETKRPSSELPKPKQKEDFGKPLNLLISQALVGKVELTKEWKEWLKTLKDYTQSIETRSDQLPKRVVITNGDWFILFLDPEDTFISLEPSPNKIRIWETWNQVEEQSNELFEELDYYSLLDEPSPISSAEVGFYLKPEQVDRTMFGLRLMYVEEPEFYYDYSPLIKIVPLIFVRAKNGVWFRIEDQNSTHTQRIPNKADSLQQHLDDFERIATNLLEAVNKKLGSNLVCSSLLDHYADENLFYELTPVTTIRNFVTTTRNGYEEFVILTGNNTHYLLKEATVSNCPYHSWLTTNLEGYAQGDSPVTRPKVNNPKTIFISDAEHHCSHREVMQAKSSKVTGQNRERCGPRSGRNQDAFCEIWRFEQHLCCRTCVFQEVCTKAEVFQVLPCKDGSTPV